MNEPVTKYDILWVLICMTVFAIGITISIVPKLNTILKKLDAIEQKIQPNKVILPEVSGKKDEIEPSKSDEMIEKMEVE